MLLCQSCQESVNGFVNFSTLHQTFYSHDTDFGLNMREEGKIANEVLFHKNGVAAVQGIRKVQTVPKVRQKVGGTLLGSAQGDEDSGKHKA